MGNESSYFFAMLVFVEGNIFHEGSDWNLTVKMLFKLTSPNVMNPLIDEVNSATFASSLPGRSSTEALACFANAWFEGSA